MFDLMQEDGWKGPFNSGSGPHGASEGRLGGGGWINGPMAVSDEDGKGFWPAPIGADPDGPGHSVPTGEHAGNSLLRSAEGYGRF